MRKKWKYVKKLAICNGLQQYCWGTIDNLNLICSLPFVYCQFDKLTASLLPLAFCLLLQTSCNQQNEHKHISTSTNNDLDGLVQPTNQSVFSNAKTIVPIEQTVQPVFKATGIISYDPRLTNNISARFTGRIEKLYLRYNFQVVSKGQRIMDIYSPEIETAQQDLLFLLNRSPNETELIKSSKQKLKWFGLTDEQLEHLEKVKQIYNPLPVYSPYSGHIHDIGKSANNLSTSSSGKGMDVNMNNSKTSNVQIENIPTSQTSALSFKEGMYIQKGQTLFAVYNINMVWVVLNIFPGDATYIKIGDKVTITEETHPDETIVSKINYIEPASSQNASTIKARVYLQNNQNQTLKIGTLITANIISKEIKGLWLPRQSVLNLGQSQIAFLKIEDHFETKSINTGMVTDSVIQVISGIEITDSVAANAQYLIDSESFIKNK